MKATTGNTPCSVFWGAKWYLNRIKNFMLILFELTEHGKTISVMYVVLRVDRQDDSHRC